MTVGKFSEAIRRAIILPESEVMQSIPEADFAPSFSFQKKMHHISSSCGKPYFRLTCTPLRRALMIAIAVTIMMFIMCSAAIAGNLFHARDYLHLLIFSPTEQEKDMLDSVISEDGKVISNGKDVNVHFAGTVSCGSLSYVILATDDPESIYKGKEIYVFRGDECISRGDDRACVPSLITISQDEDAITQMIVWEKDHSGQEFTLVYADKTSGEITKEALTGITAEIEFTVKEDEYDKVCSDGEVSISINSFGWHAEYPKSMKWIDNSYIHVFFKDGTDMWNCLGTRIATEQDDMIVSDAGFYYPLDSKNVDYFEINGEKFVFE